MQKKYIVRLSDEERSALQDLVKKLKGTSQKVKRAQILLKADANGPGWTDQKIAEAFDCCTQTVEDVSAKTCRAWIRRDAQWSEANAQADTQYSGRSSGSSGDRDAAE